MTEVSSLDVLRARDGDRDAFDRIAMQVVDRLYRIARLTLRDTERAEDAAQEDAGPVLARPPGAP